jgi:hypothetical protein
VFSGRNNVLWMLLAAVCALAALKGAWDLSRVLLIEARGAIDTDASLYFIVGRGIVNGLVPYRDLFESKPPGMFLLSVLSLALTGGELLALSLQIFVFVAIPALLAIFAWNECRAKPVFERAALSLGAMAIGTAISLYVEERAGGIQSEAFASFYALVFLLIALNGNDARFSWKRAGLLAIPLLLAIGTKEPFLISLGASALLITGFSRKFVESFVVPLCVAGVVGVFAMLALGWLGPYLSVYLPSLKGHVNSSPFDPVEIRGFTPGRLWGNMTQFYTAPLFGWLIGLLWLLFPVLKSRKSATLIDTGITLVQSFLAYIALMYAFFFLVTWNIWRQGYELAQPLAPFSLGTYMLMVAGALAMLAVQWKRGRLLQSLEAILAIYLAAATVGVSIYAKNHYVFAVPAYLALVLVFLRYASREEARAYLVLPLLAVAVAGSLVYVPSASYLDELTDRIQYSSSSNAETAATADALLTACNEERYGLVRAFSRLAFMKHSPLGPLIHPPFFEYLGKDNPLFAETYERLDTQANIVFMQGTTDDVTTVDILRKSFTEVAPACAKPFLPMNGLTVLFRKDAVFGATE